MDNLRIEPLSENTQIVAEHVTALREDLSFSGTELSDSDKADLLFESLRYGEHIFPKLKSTLEIKLPTNSEKTLDEKVIRSISDAYSNRYGNQVFSLLKQLNASKIPGLTNTKELTKKMGATMHVFRCTVLSDLAAKAYKKMIWKKEEINVHKKVLVGVASNLTKCQLRKESVADLLDIAAKLVETKSSDLRNRKFFQAIALNALLLEKRYPQLSSKAHSILSQALEIEATRPIVEQELAVLRTQIRSVKQKILDIRSDRTLSNSTEVKDRQEHSN